MASEGVTKEGRCAIFVAGFSGHPACNVFCRVDGSIETVDTAGVEAAAFGESATVRLGDVAVPSKVMLAAQQLEGPVLIKVNSTGKNVTAVQVARPAERQASGKMQTRCEVSARCLFGPL